MGLRRVSAELIIITPPFSSFLFLSLRSRSNTQSTMRLHQCLPNFSLSPMCNGYGWWLMILQRTSSKKEEQKNSTRRDVQSQRFYNQQRLSIGQGLGNTLLSVHPLVTRWWREVVNRSERPANFRQTKNNAKKTQQVACCDVALTYKLLGCVEELSIECSNAWCVWHAENGVCSRWPFSNIFQTHSESGND